MYNFKEKMHHYNDLMSEQHAEVDKALLKEKHPTSYVVDGNFTGRKLAEEVLYNLLDVATREDIIANRRQKTKPGDDEKKAVARLSEIVKAVKSVSYAEALELMKEAEELLVAFVPIEKAEKWLIALDKAMPEEPTDNDSDNDGHTGDKLTVNAPAPSDFISGEGKPEPSGAPETTITNVNGADLLAADVKLAGKVTAIAAPAADDAKKKPTTKKTNTKK